MTWGNQNTEKEALEQLSYAFDQGINIFDSAEMVSPVPHCFLFLSLPRFSPPLILMNILAGAAEI